MKNVKKMSVLLRTLIISAGLLGGVSAQAYDQATTERLEKAGIKVNKGAYGNQYNAQQQAVQDMSIQPVENMPNEIPVSAPSLSDEQLKKDQEFLKGFSQDSIVGTTPQTENKSGIDEKILGEKKKDGKSSSYHKQKIKEPEVKKVGIETYNKDTLKEMEAVGVQNLSQGYLEFRIMTEGMKANVQTNHVK